VSLTRRIVEPRPAASVVLLRDGDAGPEILYVLRNPTLDFMGGYWVFPGGRIDKVDHMLSGSPDEDSEARRAAVRETHEETGLKLDPTHLHRISHWTTPVSSPIRFATWFFAAPLNTGKIHVDGVEILNYRWLRPEDALRAHRAHKLLFANPTFALTTRLAGHDSVRDTLVAIDNWPLEQLLGRIHHVDGGRVALYTGDCGYETGRVECKGPHHRIWMLDTGWRYERAFESTTETENRGSGSGET